MVELSWPPRTIGSLTIVQLACLASSKPPGRRSFDTGADFSVEVRAEAEQEAAWTGTAPI